MKPHRSLNSMRPVFATSPPASRMAAGLVLSSGIALLGMRKQSLAASGAIGAVLTGTLTTAFGGYSRAALLVSFFASSSALSRLNGQKQNPVNGIAARSERRDIVQVLANGGVPTALAVFGRDGAHLLPYVGALAAVTGDTWATEVGKLGSALPRHILTGNSVPAGTSGGVSVHGTLASIVGGALIGAVAATGARFEAGTNRHAREFVATGIAGGAIGSLVDSLLGATLQERRWCEHCEKSTERPVHWCGEPTRVTGGVPGLNNDAVNFLASLTGAAVGWAIQHLLQRGSEAL